MQSAAHIVKNNVKVPAEEKWRPWATLRWGCQWQLFCFCTYRKLVDLLASQPLHACGQGNWRRLPVSRTYRQHREVTLEKGMSLTLEALHACYKKLPDSGACSRGGPFSQVVWLAACLVVRLWKRALILASVALNACCQDCSGPKKYTMWKANPGKNATLSCLQAWNEWCLLNGMIFATLALILKIVALAWDTLCRYGSCSPCFSMQLCPSLKIKDYSSCALAFCLRHTLVHSSSPSQESS